MPFSYYARLSRADKEIYRRSDAKTSIRVPGGRAMQPLAAAIAEALAKDDRAAVAAASTALCNALTQALGTSRVVVEVLEVRPRGRGQELHGLYTLTSSGRARIRVWMRTAQKSRVVAPKTFLRTLLHELCHHFDYTLLDLDPSFHTAGFFKRESSLFHQLMAKPEPKTGPEPEGASPRAE